MAEQARLTLPADVMEKILGLLPPPPPPGPKLVPCIRMRFAIDWLYIYVSKAVSEEECVLIYDGLGFERHIPLYWGFRVYKGHAHDVVANALMLGYTFSSPRDEDALRDGIDFTMYKK